MFLFQFTHPGKGATSSSSIFRTASSWFQFTHPGKGATSSSSIFRTASSWFQFTHPGKGATGQKWIISKPRRGFNSRTLGRVRRKAGDDEWWTMVFQFTHPGKGATEEGEGELRLLQVSIHAPWEGCDGSEHAYCPSHSSFNSRTLGRVRRAG